MVKKSCVMRVARPTDNLQAIAEMYEKGLGFERLTAFKGHAGFDGVILGHPKHAYHLEFTCQLDTEVGKAPSADNLLVFYLADEHEWQDACNRMENAGFKDVQAGNPYWDAEGRSFEDVDGYRVVIQNRAWLY
jgi:YycE-like N-terminal domain/YycE-like C-terminal domain